METTTRNPENGTDPESNTTPTTHAGDLTAFQRDILTIIAEEARYGLAIKRELETQYGEEVNHGRLYPNLDDLVDMGLVEKSKRDDRTNEYALTDAGLKLVVDQAEWVFDHLSDRESLEDVLEDHLAVTGGGR